MSGTGDPETWPLALRVALGICRNALSPIGVCWGPELNVLYNDAWRALLGSRHPGTLGVPARELFAEIWDVVSPLIEATAHRGEATVARRQRLHLTRNGVAQDWFFDFTFNPISDALAGTRGVFVLVEETTVQERVATETRLSAQCFRTLAVATNDTLYRMDATGRDLVELHGGRLLEHPRHNEPSSNWLIDYVHPDDHDGTRRAWNHAMSTGTPFEREVRARRADGSWCWVLSHCVPVRDENGVIVEWIGAAKDIDARKRAEEALTADVRTLKRVQGEQNVLMAELQHRTRNLLSLVRVIAARTFEQCEDVNMIRTFAERLASLGRVQGLVSRADCERIQLAELVRSELAPYARSTPAQLEVHGPDVRLSHHQLQGVALAVHELATNASKYGALQAPMGRLSVTWETWSAGQGRPRLALTWKESGVRMPAAAARRRGQGRELIENALRYSLRADTQYVFGNDGVWCRIELPIERAESA